MNPPFVRGDRVRWDTTGADGLPLTHYGFIGGRVDAGGRVVVMLDGHLKGDTVVPAEQLQVVSVLTTWSCSAGTTVSPLRCPSNMTTTRPPASTRPPMKP